MVLAKKNALKLNMKIKPANQDMTITDIEPCRDEKYMKHIQN